MRTIVRNRILKKYSYKCNRCGSVNNLEIDHIIPLSRGGKHDENNFQVLCKTCNLKKGKSVDFSKFIIIGESPDYIEISNKFPLTPIAPLELTKIIEFYFAKNDEVFSK